MTALDSNVLLRYLLRDDEPQWERAHDFIQGAAERGELLFISTVVLAEVVWVLRRGLRFGKKEVVVALREILETVLFQFERADVFSRAIADYASGKGDFSDYLIAGGATASGCDRIATFDRHLLEYPRFFEPE
ncbi:MAG: putative nucleic-acid-binding protein [Rhodothermales bacterium]|jgi:predicted nucleic-acid-binding protein